MLPQLPRDRLSLLFRYRQENDNREGDNGPMPRRGDGVTRLGYKARLAASRNDSELRMG
jgi:hypothetical protein